MSGLQKRAAARALVAAVSLLAGVVGMMPGVAGADPPPPSTTPPSATAPSPDASTEPTAPPASEATDPAGSEPATTTEPGTTVPEPSDPPPSSDVPPSSEPTTTDVTPTTEATTTTEVPASTELPLEADSMLMLMALPPANCSVRVNLGARWMPGTSCLESRLQQIGFFSGSPDDIFDGTTGQAILNFQLADGTVPPTGQPDNPTLVALGIWAGPPAANCSVKVEMGPPWMPGNTCLERRLAQLGLFWKGADDFADYDTAVGVSLFQQSAGLSNTARANQATLSALGIWAGPPPAPCSVRVGLGAPWMPGNACLEHRLAQLGLFGRTPDDMFDWDTMVGVSLFQQSAGLSNTASPDQNTLSRLGIWAGPPAATCSVNVGLGASWMPGTTCLERRLAQLGLFSKTPNDIFDWDTAVGVSLYQQSAGLTNSASPDKATLTRLGIWSEPGAAPCTVTNAVTPQNQAGTRCLELRLAQLGLFSRSPDDTYDWDTAVGVSLYQQSAGLPNSSVADVNTVVALRILPNPNPLPENSGTGRRIVYSRAQQRLWAVDEAGNVVKTHRVSGRTYEPTAGTYHVYSRSEYTYSANDPSVRWRYMVRFTYGFQGGRIGFHEIPNRNGVPLQTSEQLGLPLSGGCVRQNTADALWIWNWAPIGTKVVVL